MKPPPSSRDRPLVLLVEDGPWQQAETRRKLAAIGYKPTACSTVALASRVLDREFAAFVIDVCLLDGSGFELLGRIRESKRHARTPVVLMSADERATERRTLDDRTVFLVKGFDEEGLARAIRSASSAA